MYTPSPKRRLDGSYHVLVKIETEVIARGEIGDPASVDAQLTVLLVIGGPEQLGEELRGGERSSDTGSRWASPLPPATSTDLDEVADGADVEKVALVEGDVEVVLDRDRQFVHVHRLETEIGREHRPFAHLDGRDPPARDPVDQPLDRRGNLEAGEIDGVGIGPVVPFGGECGPRDDPELTGVEQETCLAVLLLAARGAR